MTRSVESPGASTRRDQLLRLLRDSSEPRSIAGLADELGIHPNTVRFHLNALVQAGIVEQATAATGGPGRPPVLFRAARRMNPDGPTNFQLLADIMTSYFTASTDEPGATAVELGRQWGSSLVKCRPGREPSGPQALAALTEVLAEVGFAPEPPSGRGQPQIRLRHCPFYALIGTHGEAICGLHLGLMQGALAAIRGPMIVCGLDPLVEPDLCVAHLSAADGRPADGNLRA